MEALVMNALRHPVLQRAVALLLFAGAGVACVPVAAATSATQMAFEGELRAVLGDSEAVELAIQAARRAATPEAALDAFVEAYVLATEDPDAALDIARLLQDHPNRFGAPSIPLSQAVWTVANSTFPYLQRTASATLTHGSSAEALMETREMAPRTPPATPGVRTLRTQQPRAP